MRRALISVFYKDGIIEFAKELVRLDWEIISTGGTSKALKDAGIKVLEVEEVTNFPEMLDGRVKTLNPFIHGGLLYRRDNPDHVEKIKEMEIQPIDMVVNNLYPFEETLKKDGVRHEEIIENIDIGGPSMIRAAAKNYQDVIVIVDPSDYSKVLDELKGNKDVSLKTKEYLAGKVFNYTAYYDALISAYFNKINKLDFPEYMALPFKYEQDLRYGENPHQSAAFYRETTKLTGTLAGGKQLHGKALSFNNINDANGALKILKEFTEPTVVAVKHTNPCGVGSGKDISGAYDRAYECDPESIFGGVIAINREVNKDLAEKINSIFIEIVMAPSFSAEALEILMIKKNIRLLEIENIMDNEYPEYDLKKVLGGLLVQNRDILLFNEGKLEVVTEKIPSEDEMEDLIFAWKAAKNMNSNGVVIAKDKGTIGIGLGEVNRFWAVEEAIQRSGEKIKGSVLASDGFFPFSDSIDALGKAGVTAIIQPGGSVKDKDVIEAANKLGIAMVFTGIRHFKH